MLCLLPFQLPPTHPSRQVPSLLGQALPTSSKFFFTYVIMRTFMTVPLRFLITQPGVWQSWLRCAPGRPRRQKQGGGGAALCIGAAAPARTAHADACPPRPAALRLCWCCCHCCSPRLLDMFPPCRGPVPPRTHFMRHAIRSPRYGVEFGSALLIMLICIAFSIICPLMLIFGATFYAGMWLFWRCGFFGGGGAQQRSSAAAGAAVRSQERPGNGLSPAELACICISTAPGTAAGPQRPRPVGSAARRCGHPAALGARSPHRMPAARADTFSRVVEAQPPPGSAPCAAKSARSYQLIYNYQRKYEAGGLIWQFYVNRILICTAIMVAFTG